MNQVFQLVRDPHSLSYADRQLQNPENMDVFVSFERTIYISHICGRFQPIWKYNTLR